MISRQALIHTVWTDREQFPTERHEELIALLQQLEVMFPYQDQQFFVPCMLREEAPDLSYYLPASVASQSRWQLQRIIQLAAPVPVAVIPPILLALPQHGELCARWQQGCIVHFPEVTLAHRSRATAGVWLQMKKDQAREISVSAWGDSEAHVTQRLRQVTSMVVDRVTEFYHIEHQISVPCSACPVSSRSFFSMLELQRQVIARQVEVVCPSGLHGAIRIDSLVPELFFRDLDGGDGFIFDFTAFREERELGAGAFGRVLLMSHDHEPMAPAVQASAPAEASPSTSSMRCRRYHYSQLRVAAPSTRSSCSKSRLKIRPPSSITFDTKCI
jgi:hypothetical protein